ncbi:unnamed protein product [Schistocephalus solidus]|uniref:DH domain-containing protein n=1 Tax=Schistocephalus solidus TaxID=70667 RepID=A0A183SK03_SCHSO|nr:unnamed protein product [Schistocephalus solidus]
MSSSPPLSTNAAAPSATAIYQRVKSMLLEFVSSQSSTSSCITFQKIEQFLDSATSIGNQIQGFVGELIDVSRFARITTNGSPTTASPDYHFTFFPERVEQFQRRRRMLLRQLLVSERRGLRMRTDLRDSSAHILSEGKCDTSTTTHTSVQLSNGDSKPALSSDMEAHFSSLDLPIDRLTQIIAVEQVLVQLSETRIGFEKLWSEFVKRLKSLQTVHRFELRFTRLKPLLGVWESLIESVNDFLPGHSGAPLPPYGGHSGSSLRGAGDDDVDSAVIVDEDGFSECSSYAGGGGGLSEDGVDPMEGLKATQSRVNEAQTSGAHLLEDIRELIRLGEEIRQHFSRACPENPEGSTKGRSDSTGSSDSFESDGSFGLAISAHLLEEAREDLIRLAEPSVYEISPLHETGEDALLRPSLSVPTLATEEEGAVDSHPPSWEDAPGSPKTLNQPRDGTSIFDSLPDFIGVRLSSLNRLEELARDLLGKAADKLNRLVQLYTEINEARLWISESNAALAPFNSEKVAQLDAAECEAALAQLQQISAGRELNLVLKGNPGQFRRQFSDLINADLKSELAQMLRSVEEVELNLTLTTAALRQQISRHAFPLRPLPAASDLSSPSRNISVDHDPLEDQFCHKTGDRGAHWSSVDRLIGFFSKFESKSDTFNPDKSQDQSAIQPSPLPAPVPPTTERRYAMAWEELLSTERSYVKFLQAVCEVFSGDSTKVASSGLPPLPRGIHDNRALIIVNMPDQLRFHRDRFLPQLIACDGDAEKVKKLFQSSFSNMVDLYSTYCRHYERASQIALTLECDPLHSQWMSQYNLYLHALESADDVTVQDSSTEPVSDDANDDTTEQVINGGCDVSDAETGKTSTPSRPILSFSTRLLSPAQRFQRYHLLLDRLRGYATSGAEKECLSQAHQEMVDLCTTVNNLMRIAVLPGKPSRLGRLLLQDKFTVWLDETRWSSHQRHVFLFENAILLTKVRQPASLVSTVLANFGSPVGVVTSSPSAAPLPGVANHPSLSTAGDTAGLASTTDAAAPSASTAGQNATLNAVSLLSVVSPARPTGDPSAPIYDIKMEISLLQIGLTPSIRQDKRRFAVWTANRAQTYYFQSATTLVRTRWVNAINGLLMRQLKILREASRSSRTNSFAADHERHSLMRSETTADF